MRFPNMSDIFRILGVFGDIRRKQGPKSQLFSMFFSVFLQLRVFFQSSRIGGFLEFGACFGDLPKKQAANPYRFDVFPLVFPTLVFSEVSVLFSDIVFVLLLLFLLCFVFLLLSRFSFLF